MEQAVEIEAVFESMKRSKSRKVEVDLKTMSFGELMIIKVKHWSFTKTL